MLFQLLFNLCQIVLLYAMVGCGFYVASRSSRHFVFAVAAAFILAPYMTIALASRLPVWAAATVGVMACALYGYGYRAVVGVLLRKGAREGQLLIISLAVMGIGENLATLFFGATSVSLWPFSATNALLLFPLVITEQQVVYFTVGACVLSATILVWHRSLLGKAFQAMEDSPLNLALHGYNVPSLERIISAFGFALVGVTGLMWGINVRIKPSMCTEIGVAGAVIVIAGTTFSRGPGGLVLAAGILAGLRLLLSLTTEENWNLSAMLVFLLLAVIARKRIGLSARGAS